MLFIGGLVAQLPLWIARRVWGWRLIDANNPPAATENTSQFRLKDMLLVMVLLSVTMALGQAVLPRDSGPHWGRRGPEEYIGLAAIAAMNFLVALPWAWALHP